MLIVDAHLDLAYNALRGRDVTLRAADQSASDSEGTPTVGFPDLKFGGVELVCATIFCEPASRDSTGYRNAEEARAQAQRQLRWYFKQVTDCQLHLVTRPEDLKDPRPGNLDAILLLEGADALRGPDDVSEWFDAGLRIVGLAWKRTRAAGGTGEPGPLTDEGRAIVAALDKHGIIHDTSHLAEESFWQLLELSKGPVMASHSNCRAIVPTDRQLSDEMIKAIAARGGVTGINFYDKFLLPPDQHKKRPATLADIVRHIRHMCELTGNAHHVGIGTDMDGGFGAEHIPHEIITSADLPKLAGALADAKFSDEDVRGIMGENWVRFFKKNLPR
jgi:membrane dipeptidase